MVTYIRCSKYTLQLSAEHGYLELMQKLLENETLVRNASLMDHAAKMGQHEIVQWLHTYRNEGCTYEAMDQASKNGHLVMVQWLHTNGKTCTKWAMIEAARGGHLDIVQWLYTKRTELRIQRALLDRFQRSILEMSILCAAKGGHLHVVQWLFTKVEKIDLLFDSICKAAGQQPHIIEWLTIQYVNLLASNHTSFNG